MDARERFLQAQVVRESFPEFKDFAIEAMAHLGFTMTWMQCDIAAFMQHGPQYLMVQAQRGEAKSTIACLYGVWCLTQNPAARILLVSGSQDKAEENGKLMHGLITNWPMLQYLAPDKYAGDRTSIVSFDVHWSLKGVDKSASVTCLGITSSLQGYRADVLIPDDIETTKNGLSATQRGQLEHLSKEFSSICADPASRILYLGTPQTKDSIYNNLPNRGFAVRIWPGRFPTEAQEEKYGEHLAPSIRERMAVLGPRCRVGGGLDGSMGWPTDPERFNEEALVKKELDQGPEGFALQFMLNTELSDAQRQQLKLRDLIVADLDYHNVPEQMFWAADPKLRVSLPMDFPVDKAEMYYAANSAQAFTKLSAITMFVDPAGNGGDELAFAVGGVVGPYIHLIAWGGFKGGFADENLEKLAGIVRQFDVKNVLVEKNMGAGAVTLLIQNHFINIAKLKGVGIEEAYATGQKERRIIDTLRPITQRHRLIVHRTALEMDTELLKQYPSDKRRHRSGFYQMQHITTDRGSLEKDDRLDALEGLCRKLVGFLVIDEEQAARAREQVELQTFLNDPMGTAQFKQQGRAKSRAVVQRIQRRRK